MHTDGQAEIVKDAQMAAPVEQQASFGNMAWVKDSAPVSGTALKASYKAMAWTSLDWPYLKRMTDT
ncbi:MAG: hypothetical protein VB858_00625 [Planctomycetaceae bacterium]